MSEEENKHQERQQEIARVAAIGINDVRDSLMLAAMNTGERPRNVVNAFASALMREYATSAFALSLMGISMERLEEGTIKAYRANMNRLIKAHAENGPDEGDFETTINVPSAT